MSLVSSSNWFDICAGGTTNRKPFSIAGGFFILYQGEHYRRIANPADRGITGGFFILYQGEHYHRIANPADRDIRFSGLAKMANFINNFHAQYKFSLNIKLSAVPIAIGTIPVCYAFAHLCNHFIW